FSLTHDRNYSYVGVRGFGRSGDYNSRMLLLVNGHRLNENIFNGAILDNEFILDLDLIDRVEVVRGPSSSLYGEGAFFGAINVVTKAGANLGGPEVSAEFGSFNAYKGRVSYGNKFKNGLGLLLSGSYFDSEGNESLYYPEYDAPASNNGIARNRDLERYDRYFAELSFKEFTLTGAYSSRKKGVPTGAFETVFNHPDNWTVDDHSYVDLKHEHVFQNDLRIISRLFYDRYRYHGLYIYDRAEEPGDPVLPVINDDHNQGDWWGVEVIGNKKFFDRHTLTVGFEYRDNVRQDQYNADVEPEDYFYVYLDDKRSSQVWSPFAQADFQVLTNVTLSASVRHDEYDNFGGTTNPRLGLIYNPHRTTALKALYGTAFRAPSAYELYYSDEGVESGNEGTFKANPALRPETIDTYELVWEQGVGKYWRSSVSGFYYEIDDLISETLDPEDELGFFDNIDAVETRGLELELEGRFSRGFRSRISYSVQHTEDANTGIVLASVPKQMAKLNLIAPLYQEKIFAGLEFQYLSGRKTLMGNASGDYWLANLTLFSHELVKGLELSASVYNLFDKEYYHPGAAEHLQDRIQQDGRTFRVKANYRF
ncbi:MAG: TonB-dependent receptor, partial [Verrucomicrobia bacterium]|nr:TonB-dependent receptor [Verrucomicrobiota bacterium]